MKDILTEEEAKERRCPYSFAPPWSQNGDTLMSMSGSASGLGSSFAALTSPTNCIASKCMAWRLAHKDGPDGSERGYCGAFGQPRFV